MMKIFGQQVVKENIMSQLDIIAQGLNANSHAILATRLIDLASGGLADREHSVLLFSQNQ